MSGRSNAGVLTHCIYTSISMADNIFGLNSFQLIFLDR